MKISYKFPVLLVSFLLILSALFKFDHGKTEVSQPIANASEQAANQKNTNITIKVGGRTISAVLDDSKTSQSFIAKLPYNITMRQWGEREYYGKLAEKLPLDGEAIETFSNGDVTFYPRGGSLAIFYANDDKSKLSGLIRMGKITSDLKVFEGLPMEVNMLIEKE